MGFCTRCGEITGSSGRCKCGGTSKGPPHRSLVGNRSTLTLRAAYTTWIQQSRLRELYSMDLAAIGGSNGTPRAVWSAKERPC